MRTVVLTRGMVAVVDDGDHDLVSAHKWHAKTRHGSTYAETSVRLAGSDKKKTIGMHSLIMAPPDGMLVDHVSGDGLDNQRSNLRFATAEQNAFNRKRYETNTSGAKGVTFKKSRSGVGGSWQAYINVRGRRFWLGCYPTMQLASAAYDAAAVRFFGEYARTNESIGGSCA